MLQIIHDMNQSRGVSICMAWFTWSLTIRGGGIDLLDVCKNVRKCLNHESKLLKRVFTFSASQHMPEIVRECWHFNCMAANWYSDVPLKPNKAIYQPNVPYTASLSLMCYIKWIYPYKHYPETSRLTHQSQMWLGG